MQIEGKANKMMRYVKSELQKLKRTFSLKLIWLAPLITLIFSFGGGQNSAFYFWYTNFLPGALTIICSLVMLKDSKMKYHAVFSLPVNKSKVWIGKEMSCITLFLFMSIIFLFGALILGLCMPESVSVKTVSLSLAQMSSASVILFITLLWQIPLCLFLCAKFGMFATIIINMAACIIGGAEFAAGNMWAFPYAISVRLMGPILRILPNGLPAPKGSQVLNTGVIIPGILISIILFIIISTASMIWFNKQEAK